MAASLDLLVPEIRQAAKDLVDACSQARLQPRVTSTLRSHAEQGRLYRRYLAGQAGFPVAPPGLSAHEYRLAFDLVVSPMDALADVGATWISWGGGWNPADAIHFEYPGASDLVKQTYGASAQAETGLFGYAERGAEIATEFVLPWWFSLLPSKYVTQIAKLGDFPAQLAAARQVIHFLYPDVKI